jgi:tRNA (cytidine/uridine-2'-O-)-methyltransferase
MVIQRTQLPFQVPDPPLQIVLVEPKIPPNTGNVARLCAATGSTLHLVEPLGFKITDASLKRAGLDYWDAVTVIFHPNTEAFLARVENRDSLHFFTTRAGTPYTETPFAAGDFLVFGSETEGLPADLIARYEDRCFGIPILLDHVRSLNLATSVGIAAYEALRRLK